MPILKGMQMRVLCEYGSQDSFHRWIHEFVWFNYSSEAEYLKVKPGVMEVANWPPSCYYDDWFGDDE